jgi:hypothetical protein
MERSSWIASAAERSGSHELQRVDGDPGGGG